MHRADLDLATALALPRSCPCCGSDELLTESDDGGVVLVCSICRRRWHPELGTLLPAGQEISGP